MVWDLCIFHTTSDEDSFDEVIATLPAPRATLHTYKQALTTKNSFTDSPRPSVIVCTSDLAVALCNYAIVSWLIHSLQLEPCLRRYTSAVLPVANRAVFSTDFQKAIWQQSYRNRLWH